ncbi:hypothetical protein CLV47_12037 [Antricoccus suffuscus]|uniref:Uncharacterized protein n=1 Tax=Antricoccus suffuscus TaxID=1629062 RepID=A0A2T0ZQF4_9ACTN|nr:hypothetical protein [Antricoccus suffuscus]PRZ38570.1 hypothetical protein CLV47_12037 [Antricoccus suffuscus]
MSAKKIIGLLLIAFVVFYVLSNPTDASDLIKNAASGLKSAAQSFAQFIGSIGS